MPDSLMQARSRNAVVHRKSVNATPEEKHEAKQALAAAKVEAAILRALADAPKLTREQANAIVGLLLVNTEPPQAGWVEEPTAGGAA